MNTKWEEQFDEMKKGFLAVKNGEWWASDEDYIKAFIKDQITKAQQEIAESIIEDIGNDDDLEIGEYWAEEGFSKHQTIGELKDQLKSKYLNENNQNIKR